MFPKSPTRQMYPNPGNLIHHIQFHNYHQWHKKKGFLAKLFKTRSNRAFYANGSTLPTNGRATDDASATTTAATISTAISAKNTSNNISEHPQYQPYMQNILSK